MSEASTEQLIKEQVKSLPKPVQEAIASFDWARLVFDIGRKYNLHVDEIGEVQTEVMLVVLGLISPKDFYDQMVSHIGIKQDQALEIASEINEKVFLRIRDFMKNYYAEEDKKDTQIVPSEKRILNNAGIKIGDEVNETHSPPILDKASSVGDNEKLVDLPAKKTAMSQIKKIESPAEPEMKEKLKDLPVLQNPPKNYFDPYREPVE